MTTRTHRILKQGLWAVLLLGMAASRCWADKIGDPAAALTIKEWVKGKPVTIKPGTNLVVVHFWSTRSRASQAAIFGLNQLQDRLRSQGVLLVGICDDTPAQAKALLSRPEFAVEYAIGCDDERKTAQAYMQAFGQAAIPYAFVVGTNGTVLWHGHPRRGLNKALEEILGGRYDLARVSQEDAVRAESVDYWRSARQGDPQAKALGRKVMDRQGTNAAALCQFAYRLIINPGITNRDFALAEEALNRAEKADGKKTSQVVLTRAALLIEQGKTQAGLDLSKDALKLVRDPKAKLAVEKFIGSLEDRVAAREKGKEKGGTNAVPAVKGEAAAGPGGNGAKP